MPHSTPEPPSGAATRFRLWPLARRSRPARGAGSARPAPVPAPDAYAEPALWRLRTTVRDTPGSLAAVCAALAGARVDIVTLQTHPLAEGTVDEFLLRAPGGTAGPELARLVDGAGGTDTWLERADTHASSTPPPRSSRSPPAPLSTRPNSRWRCASCSGAAPSPPPRPPPGRSRWRRWSPA
jgi:hypothetical protein